MATSIFPDIDSAGGVVIRDAAGNCLAPPEVHNAYCPPAGYIVTCDMTALPSNCDARIEPRQINAIISELVSFAECLDPNGPWDCNSLNNLCTAFNEWVSLNLVAPPGAVHVGDVPPAAPYINQLWWESDTGHFFIYYQDASGPPQWVQVNGDTASAGGSPGISDGVSVIGDGTVINPYAVYIVDCGSY